MQLDQGAAGDNSAQDHDQKSDNREDAKYTAAGVQINGTSKRKRPEEIIAMLQHDASQQRDGDAGEAASEKGGGRGCIGVVRASIMYPMSCSALQTARKRTRKSPSPKSAPRTTTRKQQQRRQPWPPSLCRATSSCWRKGTRTSRSRPTGKANGADIIALQAGACVSTRSSGFVLILFLCLRLLSLSPSPLPLFSWPRSQGHRHRGHQKGCLHSL